MGSGAHQVTSDGARDKGLAELNNDVYNEGKDVRDGIMGEGQELSEEDESKINDGREGGLAPEILQGGVQKQHQQQLPPGPVVRWEKILPVRTLKVLLVESDDSTRHVVSALLRNCSYEVTATDSGLQAWKILENPANHIDLILTEVAMPGISGITLLSKIMSTDACKNIPVIMMSSSDSMGTVFKCLSKGAVDFLVKPIRKNELKNLWQHVWRRSHSSSGSVSESGIQTQKSIKSKSADDSYENSSSNGGDDIASIGMNARDGSDNGSGTQSSWTKHAVEVDSPQPMSPMDQAAADPHDSTCARVISDSEIFCNKWVSMNANIECQEPNKHTDAFMGKDLEIGVPRNSGIKHDLLAADKTATKMAVKVMDKQPEEAEKNEDVPELKTNNVVDEPRIEVFDLIGGIAKSTDTPLANGVTETPNCFSMIPESKDKNDDGSLELPSLQLSLKRLRSPGGGGNVLPDDRNILRRSDQSAFSRYRTSAASTQAPTGCVGSCSPVDHSSKAVKTESTQNMISNSNLATTKQGSNGSSDNNDKGSTTNPAAYKDKAITMLGARSNAPSAFHPVHARTSMQVAQEKIDDTVGNTVGGQSTAAQCQYQVQHHHHHYHHHHHHVHNTQKQQQSEHNDLSHKSMVATAQLCGSSNVFSGPTTEGNVPNCSLNGSKSGSNHGGNGQKGSSAAVNTGLNVQTTNGVAEKCGTAGGGGGGSGSGSGVEQNRLAQREAALNKFRQKRKERNFGKKVRYQSRKRLAEQRPRVRGQFVRQPAQESKSQGADS